MNLRIEDSDGETIYSRERMYTLDQARRVIAESECAVEGHDFDVIQRHTMNGTEPVSVACSRCNRSWPVGTM